jgi:hypothetical protein
MSFRWISLQEEWLKNGLSCTELVLDSFTLKVLWEWPQLIFSLGHYDGDEKQNVMEWRLCLVKRFAGIVENVWY